MESATDFQEPDESRPAKRVRLEAPMGITEEVQEELVDDEDWDDIYGLDAANGNGSDRVNAEETVSPNESLKQSLESPVAAIESEPIPSAAAPPAVDDDLLSANVQSEARTSGKPEDSTIDTADELVVEKSISTTDLPSAKILEETTQIETELPNEVERPKFVEREGEGGGEEDEQENRYSNAMRDSNEQASGGAENAVQGHTDTSMVHITDGNASQSTTKPMEDAEFFAAGTAQKDDEQAEWQLDSSDAGSSDSDSDSSSDEGSDDADSDSEEGYEMLDPATAAKILMAGDGEDDQDEKGKGGDRQPRTVNEVKEEVVPKPDVVVTEDMKTTYLGTVDRIADNLILIKAATPGEFQVLEYGSVLCTENREVVGAVADTLGRVLEPIYSVAFTNAKEIEDAGYESGTKIFYLDSHSSFVFTQPLKNLKGTDASNIHDEEVGEDEIEFSDDEKEAEYKRTKKLAKREGRGKLSRGAFNEERASRVFDTTAQSDSGYGYVNGTDAPRQQYGAGISYDDVDVQDEFYSPLKRPDNLSQLMAGGGPPRPQQGNFDRGRGRGRGDRGRGRGDRGRGRGRGGYDNPSQRGARGGHGQNRGGPGQQSGHKGSAHSFPDRHNDYSSDTPQRQHVSPPNPNLSRVPPQHQHQYPAHQQYPAQQAQSPQSYHFNGYTFQYGNMQPPPEQHMFHPQQQQQQPPAQRPSGAFPAGSYVNPTSYQNQQQQSQLPGHNGWQQNAAQNIHGPSGASSEHVGNYAPAQTGQQKQGQPAQQNPNLADILRQLGGPQI